MQITTLEIAGFESSFKAMRLPRRSNSKADSKFNYDHIEDKENILDSYSEKGNRDYIPIWNTDNGYNIFILGPNDLKLAQKLILAGDEHSKNIRGIQVWAEFTASMWFWNQLCTYEVGVTKLSSTSTDADEEFKHLPGEEIEKLKDKQLASYEYTRIYIFNYQSLRHIYFQRKHHKLPTWNKVCEWIKSLPLAKELITIEK